MKAPDVVTLDWETHPIKRRPHYPPEPVGLAVLWPDNTSRYLAFGHPAGNNATRDEVLGELARIWDSGLPVLCHNSKFDLAVCCEKVGFPDLPWERVHDTMFLAYLCDPHARSLGLKDLAEDLLNWAPEERDAVADWVIAHKKELLARYPENRKINKKTGLPVDNIAPKDVGAWIFSAPGDLVGEYALGDVKRTAALFKHLWPIVQNEGMGEAYDRERQLQPILMENERLGIRVNLAHLEEDIRYFDAAMEHVEGWMRRELRASGLNFDADADLASVLLARGIVPEANWQTTKSGALSTSKENLLPEHFTGPNGAQIASALGYRNRLKTCLTMFMKPWYEQGAQRGGVISTNWNQVRNPEGGTRTGRPSTSDPNFLNISKDFGGRTDGFVHPEFLEVDLLPLVRKYILPDEGEVFLHRDFDGQELRVFAHFEQGALWQAYQENADLDPHSFVGDTLKELTGQELERTKIKVLNFQALYGGGVPAAQRKLNCSYAEAKQYKAFHDKALPGRKILNDEIKRIVGRGEPIRTWGGRLYFPEPPRMVDGRMRDFVYKLINYLVQGSAADLTKQALIDWHSAAGRTARFLVTVYDEINITAPPDTAESQMALLRDVMETRRLTVPMRSSGKQGPTWGDLTKCD